MDGFGMPRGGWFWKLNEPGFPRSSTNLHEKLVVTAQANVKLVSLSMNNRLMIGLLRRGPYGPQLDPAVLFSQRVAFPAQVPITRTAVPVPS